MGDVEEIFLTLIKVKGGLSQWHAFFDSLPAKSHIMLFGVAITYTSQISIC